MNSIKNPQKIAIRTPNWLGDLVVSTGFIRAVLDRWPSAGVDLIVRRGFESLPLPHRGAVLPFDRAAESAWAFGRRLGPYDAFFVLPPSFSSAWMAFASGSPVRVGHAGHFRSALLRPAVRTAEKPRARHLIAEFMDLLEPRPDPDVYRPRLPVDEGWIERTLPKAFPWGQERYWVIAPGAAFGPAKQWPMRHVETFIRSAREKSRRLAVIGLADQEAAIEALRDGDDGVLNLCGRTSLNEMVAVVARAEALVSNDSGVMHIGAALDRPQVAVFGSTNPAWTRPLNPGSAVLYRNLDCSPCYARECPLGHTLCLESITPDSVMAAVENVLNNAPGPVA